MQLVVLNGIQEVPEMRRAAVIQLTDDEQTTLKKWSRGKTTAARIVERANVVLLAAQGIENKDIAEQLGLSAPMVGKWRSRFFLKRLAGIECDLPRSGRRPSARARLEDVIIRKTTEELPEDGGKWSARSLAKAVGSNKATVQRVWHDHGLKPHLTKTFKFTGESQPAGKRLADIVGLYSNSEENALVWACGSSNPSELAKGLPQTVDVIETSNTIKDSQSTASFSAIETLAVKLSRQSAPAHRSQDWLRFLKKIDSETPQGFDLYLLVNNYSTNNHPKVKMWLRSNQRFNISFVPEEASWFKIIDHWLHAIAGDQTPDQVFNSLGNMNNAITESLTSNVGAPGVFQWVNSTACRPSLSCQLDARP
jgi:transposase